MDAFDDGFGGEVEVDPAAEFLAKEQEVGAGGQGHEAGGHEARNHYLPPGVG